MYLFYVDESGSRDPDCGLQTDGTCTKDWLYVLTAVGLYEGGWKKFYGNIVSRKRELLARLNSCHGLSLDLDVTEIKSNWIRIPKERAKHPFLSQLTDPDISALVRLYFEQLADLCGYSVYRALRDSDPDYEYFQLVQPQFVRGRKKKCHGLKIYPALSDLHPTTKWIDGGR